MEAKFGKLHSGIDDNMEFFTFNVKKQKKFKFNVFFFFSKVWFSGRRVPIPFFPFDQRNRGLESRTLFLSYLPFYVNQGCM